MLIIEDDLLSLTIISVSLGIFDSKGEMLLLLLTILPGIIIYPMWQCISMMLVYYIN